MMRIMPLYVFKYFGLSVPLLFVYNLGNKSWEEIMFYAT